MPDMPNLGGTLADRYQLSPKSLHAGHDPRDPRVAMVEAMAINDCGGCASGEHRWRDRQSGEFLHPDEFGYEASECEADNMLRIAIEHGVPIYTGAELEFPDEPDRPTPSPSDGGADV